MPNISFSIESNAAKYKILLENLKISDDWINFEIDFCLILLLLHVWKALLKFNAKKIIFVIEIIYG